MLVGSGYRLRRLWSFWRIRISRVRRNKRSGDSNREESSNP